MILRVNDFFFSSIFSCLLTYRSPYSPVVSKVEYVIYPCIPYSTVLSIAFYYILILSILPLYWTRASLSASM